MKEEEAIRKKVVKMILERVIQSLKRENLPITKESVALVFTEYLKALSKLPRRNPVHRDIIAKFPYSKN